MGFSLSLGGLEEWQKLAGSQAGCLQEPLWVRELGSAMKTCPESSRTYVVAYLPYGPTKYIQSFKQAGGLWLAWWGLVLFGSGRMGQAALTTNNRPHTTPCHMQCARARPQNQET